MRGAFCSLCTLSMAACGFGDEGIALLVVALSGHPHLLSLDLAQNEIGPTGAIELASRLLQPFAAAPPSCDFDPGSSSQTSAMEVDTDGGTGDLGDAACRITPPSSPNETFAAHESRCSGRSPNARCDALRSIGTRLRSLDLSHNPLGEVGLRALASGVERCATLHALALRYVNREPNDADGRLEPFPLSPLLAPSSLSTLDLSYNFVAAASTSSVDDLREALSANQTLTSLSLRRCCIGGWRRARAIARGLARNNALTSLDLGYNGLGAATQRETMNEAGVRQPPRLSLAVDALCDAMRENLTLTHLGLAHNALGGHGALAVLQAGLRSPSLTSLDLRANEIPFDALRKATALLAHARVQWLPAVPRPFGSIDLASCEMLCPPWLEASDGDGRVLRQVDLRQNATCEMLVARQGAEPPEAAWRRMPELPPVRRTAPSRIQPAAAAAEVGCATGRRSEEDSSIEKGGSGLMTLHHSQIVAGLGRRQSARELCPYYMCRQLEVNPQMRKILISWLVELFDELELSTEVLLHGVYHVDRFLSSQAVPKEALQLVGAVALMIASNHFCKLPHQDGERPGPDHAFNHADDIVYWTDNTYSVDVRAPEWANLTSNPPPLLFSPLQCAQRQASFSASIVLDAQPAFILSQEVFTMEARLLYGFEIGSWESPTHFLAQACSDWDAQMPDATLSIATEVIVCCGREYLLLRVHPRLVAACALYVAVRNTPDHVAWSDSLAACCGYPTSVIEDHISEYFGALDGVEISCRRLGSTSRARTLTVTLIVKDG